VLENVKVAGVQKVVADASGKTLLTQQSGVIKHWALGPVYTDKREFSMGKVVPGITKNSRLLDMTKDKALDNAP
jgi:hypothetical protein